jgi:hypothetical protein
MTFYCLKFETLLTWKARFPYLFPPGTDGTVIPQPLGSLSAVIMIRRDTVEVLDPASTGIIATESFVASFKHLVRTSQKTDDGCGCYFKYYSKH